MFLNRAILASEVLCLVISLVRLNLSKVIRRVKIEFKLFVVTFIVSSSKTRSQVRKDTVFQSLIPNQCI